MPRVSPEAAQWSSAELNQDSFDIAIDLACASMVRQILDHGVDVEGLLSQADDDGFSPAMLAALAGQWDIVQMLLAAGADPLRSSVEPGVEHGYPDSVLVAAASGSGDLEVLSMLTEQLGLGEGRNEPAAAAVLESAVSTGTVGAAEVLLDAGVPPTLSALLDAAQVVSPPEILELLERAGPLPPGSVEAAEVEEVERFICDPSSTWHDGSLYGPASVAVVESLIGEVVTCDEG